MTIATPPPILSDRTKATLLRFAKGLFASVVILVCGSTLNFITNNTLGLSPDSLTFVVAGLSPIVLAAEKWANWFAAS